MSYPPIGDDRESKPEPRQIERDDPDPDEAERRAERRAAIAEYERMANNA